MDDYTKECAKAGLKVMEKNDIAEKLKKCIRASYDRAIEIEKELSGGNDKSGNGEFYG